MKEAGKESASAQEIAEKAATKIHSWFGHCLFYGEPSEIKAIILSAITAAVAQATKELQAEVDEQALVILQGVIALKRERNLRNTDQIIEIDEYGKVHPEGALDFMKPVAQAKEEELRAAWEAGVNTARGYGDNLFHLEGEQKERVWQKVFSRLKEALELKEPSPESNLSTQNALDDLSYAIARSLYGYWHGDSTGSTSAMIYFDSNRTLTGFVGVVERVKRLLSEHSNAAGAPPGKQDPMEASVQDLMRDLDKRPNP